MRFSLLATLALAACTSAPLPVTSVDGGRPVDAVHPASAAVSVDAEVPEIRMGRMQVVSDVSAKAAPQAPSTPRARGPNAPRAATAPRAEAPERGAARTIGAVIDAHFNDVEACYSPVAQKNPSVAGRIALQWTLGADGRPTAVTVTQDTLSDPSVAACLRGRAKNWQFPPPEGGVGVVRAPFDLRMQ